MRIGSITIQKESNTKFIAEKLSEVCQKGDLIALSGEFGSGKTTFARYFVKKVTKVNNVPSPTYNLILSYNSRKSVIYHMDAWRLKNEDEAVSLGIAEMFENSIFIIEWAEKIKNLLPDNCLNLIIYNCEKARKLVFNGGSEWKDRLKEFSLDDYE